MHFYCRRKVKPFNLLEVTDTSARSRRYVINNFHARRSVVWPLLFIFCSFSVVLVATRSKTTVLYFFDDLYLFSINCLFELRVAKKHTYIVS